MMKSVYSLHDLATRATLDAGAGKPARLAVLGWPVAHSASPQMHQPALDAAGIDARYIRLEVEPGLIPEAFARMRELGFIGCNVTVPHKTDAMANCTWVHPEDGEVMVFPRHNWWNNIVRIESVNSRAAACGLLPAAAWLAWARVWPARSRSARMWLADATPNR